VLARSGTASARTPAAPTAFPARLSTRRSRHRAAASPAATASHPASVTSLPSSSTTRASLARARTSAARGSVGSPSGASGTPCRDPSTLRGRGGGPFGACSPSLRPAPGVRVSLPAPARTLTLTRRGAEEGTRRERKDVAAATRGGGGRPIPGTAARGGCGWGGREPRTCTWPRRPSCASGRSIPPRNRLSPRGRRTLPFWGGRAHSQVVGEKRPRSCRDLAPPGSPVCPSLQCRRDPRPVKCRPAAPRGATGGREPGSVLRSGTTRSVESARYRGRPRRFEQRVGRSAREWPGRRPPPPVQARAGRAAPHPPGGWSDNRRAGPRPPAPGSDVELVDAG